MGMTVNAGKATVGAAGPAKAVCRVQTGFMAHDLTFTGSVPGTKITSVTFGDRIVWSVPEGVEIESFAVSGHMRGVVYGQTLDAGLDAIVTGDVPGPGDLRFVLTGWKDDDED